ncbi:MAG: hypothetical protein IPG43_21515 [Proteobacteria bacterium]|nr:hypothetical protein [Pseudomonadota bacterium]
MDHSRLSFTAAGLAAGMLVAAVAGADEQGAEAAASAHTFSANVGLFSEYVFRGITNSNEGPAIQGGFDYAHESGFYLGVWASNIEFGGGTSDTASIETDFYGGFTGNFANGIVWDVGLIYYAYPDQNEDFAADFNYLEGYGKLNYTWEGVTLTPSLEVGLYYSPDYFGEDGDGVYTYGTFGATLPYEFNPYVTVGYQYVDGDQTSGPAGYDYVHYAVGVNKTLGHFTADLSWQDARDLSGCNDNCEAVVFSVSSSW